MHVFETKQKLAGTKKKQRANERNQQWNTQQDEYKKLVGVCIQIYALNLTMCHLISHTGMSPYFFKCSLTNLFFP